jgi:hypothetical protein
MREQSLAELAAAARNDRAEKENNMAEIDLLLCVAVVEPDKALEIEIVGH